MPGGVTGAAGPPGNADSAAPHAPRPPPPGSQAGPGGAGAGRGAPAAGAGAGGAPRRMGSSALVDKLMHLLGGSDKPSIAALAPAGGAHGHGSPPASASGGKGSGSVSRARSEKLVANHSSRSSSPSGARAGSAPMHRARSEKLLGGAASGGGSPSLLSPSLSPAGSCGTSQRSRSGGRLPPAAGTRQASTSASAFGELADPEMEDALDRLAASMAGSGPAGSSAGGGASDARRQQQQRAASRPRCAAAPTPFSSAAGGAAGAAAGGAPRAPPRARFAESSGSSSDDDGADKAVRRLRYKHAKSANLAGVHVEPMLVTNDTGTLMTMGHLLQQQHQEVAQMHHHHQQQQNQQQQQLKQASVAAHPMPLAPAAEAQQHCPAPPSVPAPAPAVGGGSRLLCVSPRLPPAMQRAQWRLNDFRRVEVIYEGHASSVYKARDTVSGEMVALKLYHHSRLNPVSSHQVEREVRLHGSVSHENIVVLYAAFVEGTCTALVQEFAGGGDLWAFLQANSGHLSERACVALVLQPFLLALHYLHSQGIAHRDIKPENVLFSDPESLTLKLADFGLALNLREERAVTRVGTLDYMAPEVLRCPLKRSPQENKGRGELAYSEAVDAWAAGVLVYELIVGHAPFSAQVQPGGSGGGGGGNGGNGGGGDGGATQQATVNAILNAEVSFEGCAMSELAQDFVRSCLAKRPSDRPGMAQLLRHPWIRSYMRNRSGRLVRGQKGSFETVRLPTGALADLFASRVPQGHAAPPSSHGPVVHSAPCGGAGPPPVLPTQRQQQQQQQQQQELAGSKASGLSGSGCLSIGGSGSAFGGSPTSGSGASCKALPAAPCSQLPPSAPGLVASLSLKRPKAAFGTEEAGTGAGGWRIPSVATSEAGNAQQLSAASRGGGGGGGSKAAGGASYDQWERPLLGKHDALQDGSLTVALLAAGAIKPPAPPASMASSEGGPWGS